MLVLIKLLYRSTRAFIGRDGLTLAAAISFYAALSVSPLLVLLFWCASKLGITDQSKILDQLASYGGPQAAELAQSLLRNLQATPHLENLAGVFGFAVLLISAAGVFTQLRLSLNRIWQDPSQESFSLRNWLIKRLIAVAMVFVLSLLITASLASTSIVTFAGSVFGRSMWAPLFLEATDGMISLLVFSAFFALLFRFLPDRPPGWKEIRIGAFITALLFTLGKTLIGVYLGYSTLSSAFGAAGSLAVFLLWVYYSAAIFLFGAELTQQRALLRETLAA